MAKYFFVLFSLMLLHVGYCQSDFTGVFVDAKTGNAIPYVNIGIVNKGIGTVSTTDGVFRLRLNRDEHSSSDTLQISSLGYKTIKIAVPDLKFVLNEYPKFEMLPEIIQLNEITLVNRGKYKIPDLVGYQNFGEKTFGYWKDNIALGGELATKIKVKKGFRQLNTLFFEVFSNPSDSVLIRVNFYDTGTSKSMLGKNLNTSDENILHTIYPKTKMAIIDLNPFDISVKDDFIISLELLKVYGEKPIELVLAASANESTYALRKFASADKWEVLPQTAMGYHLSSTYYSDSKRVQSKVAKLLKVKTNISGFIFSGRRPLKNVKITNLVTNEEVYSNSKGRYQILGEKNDILTFELKGFNKVIILLPEKNTHNINMTRR